MSIRIIIADDHQVFVEGIKALLQEAGGFQVIAEAGNGEELVRQVKLHRPAVVLTDIQMPGGDGIKAAAEIQKKFPEVKVIALTMLLESLSIKKMLEAGACGYLIKTVNKEELIHAIRTVAAGEKYFSREAAMQLMNNFSEKPATGLADTLTKREKEILVLITQGLTDKEIAEKVFLSPLTVITHRKNILGKLGLKNKVELTRFAMENRLIS